MTSLLMRIHMRIHRKDAKDAKKKNEIFIEKIPCVLIAPLR
jgi:hypothetical protein